VRSPTRAEHAQQGRSQFQEHQALEQRLGHDLQHPITVFRTDRPTKIGYPDLPPLVRAWLA
jgi:hypothetical protein